MPESPEMPRRGTAETPDPPEGRESRERRDTREMREPSEVRAPQGERRSVVVLSGVTLGYGRRPVLTGITLEVREGEFWFLVGPNGTGKTTLLRAVLGELPALAGEIRRHPELASPRAIGFVPQRCDLNPALPTTVREFVSLGAAGLVLSRNDRLGRLVWALSEVGLAGREGHD